MAIMDQKVRNRQRKWLAALVILALVSFFIYKQVIHHRDLQLEMPPMIDLTKTQTYCVGRFQVDIPRDAYYAGQEDMFDGYDIKHETIEGKPAFDALVKKRVDELRKEPHDTEKTLLTREYKGPINVGAVKSSHVIVFRDNRLDVYVRQIEGYVQIGRTLFKIVGAVDNDRLDEALLAMDNLIKNLNLWDNKNVPKEAGICIDSGFIKDDGSALRYADHTAHFTFKEHPDTWITVSTEILAAPTKSLLTRIHSPDNHDNKVLSAIFGVKVLREGKRVAGGMSGEESIMHLPSHSDQYDEGVTLVTGTSRGSEGGAWEHTGSMDSIIDQYIKIDVSNGRDYGGYGDPQGRHTDGNATISQKTTLSLFDTIVNTVKRRDISK